MFEIRYDNDKIKRLERELQGFPKNSLPKVMSRGLNRTATQARTQTSRFISKESGVKVTDVRNKIYLDKATYRSWRSAITISGKRLSLSYMNPKKTTRGLSVKSGGKRITIRRAFFAKKGWFIRQPAGGNYPGAVGAQTAWYWGDDKLVGRLPLSRIRGPVLSRVYSNAAEQAARIHRESLGRLEKNIHDQVQLILRRRLPA